MPSFNYGICQFRPSSTFRHFINSCLKFPSFKFFSPKIGQMPLIFWLIGRGIYSLSVVRASSASESVLPTSWVQPLLRLTCWGSTPDPADRYFTINWHLTPQEEPHERKYQSTGRPAQQAVCSPFHGVRICLNLFRRKKRWDESFGICPAYRSEDALLNDLRELSRSVCYAQEQGFTTIEAIENDYINQLSSLKQSYCNLADIHDHIDL